MWLIVRRAQKHDKGWLGGQKGVKYSLSYRLELTEQEQRLVGAYLNAAFTEHNVRGAPMRYSLAQVIQGVEDIQMESIDVLINADRAVRAACEKLHALLRVLGSFNRTDIIEIGYR